MGRLVYARQGLEETERAISNLRIGSIDSSGVYFDKYFVWLFYFGQGEIDDFVL